MKSENAVFVKIFGEAFYKKLQYRVATQKKQILLHKQQNLRKNKIPARSQNPGA